MKHASAYTLFDYKFLTSLTMHASVTLNLKFINKTESNTKWKKIEKKEEKERKKVREWNIKPLLCEK